MDSESDKNAASLEFEGGLTRRGRLVLGLPSFLLWYALGAPTYALALYGCFVISWAWAYEDVAKQHADFQAAASLLRKGR